MFKDLSGGLPRRKTSREKMAPEVSNYLNWSSFQFNVYTQLFWVFKFCNAHPAVDNLYVEFRCLFKLYFCYNNQKSFHPFQRISETNFLTLLPLKFHVRTCKFNYSLNMGLLFSLLLNNSESCLLFNLP